MANFPLIDPNELLAIVKVLVGLPLIAELLLLNRTVGEVFPVANKFPLSETDEPMLPEVGVMLVIVGAGKLSFR